MAKSEFFEHTFKHKNQLVKAEFWVHYADEGYSVQLVALELVEGKGTLSSEMLKAVKESIEDLAET